MIYASIMEYIDSVNVRPGTRLQPISGDPTLAKTDLYSVSEYNSGK